VILTLFYVFGAMWVFLFFVKFDEADYLYYLRTGLCGYGINCRYNHLAYVLQVIKHLELHFRCGELSII
jgi:hypothetical protein